jgi:hypothetical protein
VQSFSKVVSQALVKIEAGGKEWRSLLAKIIEVEASGSAHVAGAENLVETLDQV